MTTDAEQLSHTMEHTQSRGDTITRPANSEPADRLTPYNEMLVRSHGVSATHNIFTAIANWIFLAGFVVLPGTFESLSDSEALSQSRAGNVVQYAIRNSPLLYVGVFCCCLGGAGMGWAWWSFKRNYIWLVDHIVFPGLLNAIVALLISLVNIYTAQSGIWSVSASVTIAIVVGYGLIMSLMLVVYQLCLLRRLERNFSKAV